MLARTILVLVSSPWYGVLIALLTIPLMVGFGLVALFVGSQSLAMAGVLTGVSFLFQALLYAQSARYAAWMTGLVRLRDQTHFFTAVWRCLLVTILTGLFSGLIMIAFFLVATQLGGADEWWWMDREKLLAAINAASASPARAEELFSFESMNLGSLVFVIKSITMFFVTLLTIFAVPRATGIGRGYHEAYALGPLLARFLVAAPFLAAMSGTLARAALLVLEAAAGVVIDDVALTASLLYMLELVLFTGMIFAFEAGLLRTGREHAGEETERMRDAGPGEAADLRAIRDAWNRRN